MDYRARSRLRFELALSHIEVSAFPMNKTSRIFESFQGAVFEGGHKIVMHTGPNLIRTSDQGT